MGKWTIPSTVENFAATHCELGSRPTVKSVPGPSKCSASKRRSVIRAATVRSRSNRSPSVAAGSSDVQPAHVGDLLPQLVVGRLGVELGVDELRPGRRRRRRDGPVRRARADDLAALLDRGQHVAADERRVEVGHQPGRDVPRQPDAGGALLAEREHALAVPGRDEVQRLRIGVLHPRPLDPGIEVRDVDELGSGAVGRSRRSRGSDPPCRSPTRWRRSGPVGRWRRRSRPARRGGG